MLKGTSVEPQNSAIPIERGSRLPFSPHSDFSESSGVCNSYSPKNSPPRTQYIQDRQPKQETQVKFEVILEIFYLRHNFRISMRLKNCFSNLPTTISSTS